MKKKAGLEKTFALRRSFSVDLQHYEILPAFEAAMDVIEGRPPSQTAPREDPVVIFDPYNEEETAVPLAEWHLMQFKRHFQLELLCARGLTPKQKEIVEKLFKRQFERLEAILVDRISHHEEVVRFCTTIKKKQTA